MICKYLQLSLKPFEVEEPLKSCNKTNILIPLTYIQYFNSVFFKYVNIESMKVLMEYIVKNSFA